MTKLLALGISFKNTRRSYNESILDDAIPLEVENNLEDLDQKAAPWWEQQEEAAKRKCQSSCTMHSKGVKAPQITLCDDTDVSF